ncbi:hypothetical protein HOU39_gp079 [Lactobacillus phage Iacchus]|uniref:Uncharacterized protein n=2 Tax=Harbinvirus TaxID=2732970 RepID=A0A3Q8I8B5_9CAUD|nr:hypothetical protein HOU39_gp079 [Lactobacillus phage Iacchus]YP_009814466.1 hypothetical protein HOU40_gp079 [Lactobacillus phage Bromius]AYH91973.1 hypothetical protein [Lactobacillus phage Iacchus]AYH92145.1 hypothetical protein [Lactobacillus phage Dionysus]AYH92315.1 hypothetical protein [Lactobacillus phage Bromius]
MKFVNQSAPVTTKKLAVGSLVIENIGKRLSPDSVAGLKVDDYHVLALGDNEAKLVKIEDGVDNHFKVTVDPNRVGIGLEPSVMDIINNRMATSTYTDHSLDFPDTDDDLYTQVKDSVPMPIDKEPSTLDQLVAIVSDFSVTKYGRLSKLAKLRDVADTSDVAELIDGAIKDLKGKHMSASDIADKYKALANDLQANCNDDDSDDEPVTKPNYKRAIHSAGEAIAKAVSSFNTSKVSETLSKLAEEAKTTKLDTKDLENDDYLKFLDKYFSELKNSKLSNSEIVAYLDKLQLDDEYLQKGISNLKDKIKEGTEDAGKMLELAKDELDSQFQLRLGLDKLMSLLGFEKEDDSKDDDDDLTDDDDDTLLELFDEVFDSYYKEGAPSDEEAKLLVRVLTTAGYIEDDDLYKFTKKVIYKLTEDDYKDNAEKVMADLAEEYEQKF